MNRNTITLSLLAFSLTACEEAPPVQTFEWAPLACDVDEETTWTVLDDADPNRVRTTTTTRIERVAIVDADPVHVVARVLRAQHDPCASLESCGILTDTRLSPDDHFVYFSAGTDVVTGLDSGETRIVCSVTHTGHVTIQRPNQPLEEYEQPAVTELRAAGGDVIVLR